MIKKKKSEIILLLVLLLLLLLLLLSLHAKIIVHIIVLFAGQTFSSRE